MTRRKHLTDHQVNALKVRPQRYFHLDPELNGHYVRVTPNGTKTFVCVARDPHKKQIWSTIGGTDLFSIDEARDEARKRMKRILKGLPPVDAAPVKPDSYKAVADLWHQQHCIEDKKLVTADEFRRILDKYILPRLGDRDFVSIKKDDVAAFMDTVSRENGRYMANACLAVMRSIATWYESRTEDYLPSAYSQKLRRATEKRQRVLTDAEIATVWKQAGFHGGYGAMVKLLLLTGQRRDKVRTMKWSDISDDGVWTIASESKREKGTGGELKLPRLALDIINAQPKVAGNEFIFASDRTDSAIVGVGKSQNIFRDACGLKTDWRLHDLRRTARTLMGERLKVPPHIAERVMGHAVGNSVERTYDVGAYAEEKAEALARLADLITAIVTPPRPRLRAVA